jgi:hypothetical protein
MTKCKKLHEANLLILTYKYPTISHNTTQQTRCAMWDISFVAYIPAYVLGVSLGRSKWCPAQAQGSWLRRGNWQLCLNKKILLLGVIDDYTSKFM